MLAQIATSLGVIGPSIGTEVNLATLRERTASLQKDITLGHQMIKLAYDGKEAAEKRETEQSGRIDKLIEQLSEANKRQRRNIDTTSPPNLGPDVNMLLTKYMQANTNYGAELSKVNQKDEELYQKSLDILVLNEKLRALQADCEASQSSLTGLQGQHHSLRGDVDAIVQENIVLKERLKHSEAASLQAANAPKLIEDLAIRDAELAKLRPEAAKVHALVQDLAGRDAELKQLQVEAAKVPALLQNLTGRDTELDQLRSEAAKVSGLQKELAIRRTELVKMQEKASAMAQLEEQIALNEAELTDLRPKAAQFAGKASQNLAYQSDIHDYKNTIQLLEQQLAALNEKLGPMRQTVANVAELQEENSALKITAKTVHQTMGLLENELRESRRTAEEVETLQKEITALRMNWADYDQLKKDLISQHNIYAKQVAHLDDLQNKLEEAQTLSNQVPVLQGEVQQLSQKCGNLGQQLNEATKIAERCEDLERGIEQKAKEIVLLRSKLQTSEDTACQLVTAQEDSQRNSRQPATLEKQITKGLGESQNLQAFQKPDVPPVDEENYLTQQTTLHLRQVMDRVEEAHEFEGTSATLQSNLFSTHQDMPRRKKAGRSSAEARNDVQCSSLRLSHAHETEISNSEQSSRDTTKDMNNTQQIPDSQPHFDMRDLLATSSPLSDVESPGFIKRLAGDTQGRYKELSGSRPPSSSCGGDAMLLEHFEAMEGMIEDRQVVESSGQKSDLCPSRRQSQKHVGYGQASSRTVFARDGNVSDSRRLRSTLSSQVIEETQSQEKRLSSPEIMPSSPAGPAKHLPNSAVKRPRFDPIEATPSTRTSSKRLKRTPENLEVRKTPKQPMSVSTQLTESDLARANRVRLPSGSRKGSVIGAHAPAHGKAQGSHKRSRKSSKSNRYAERFSQE